jgi:hypothetical protein
MSIASIMTQIQSLSAGDKLLLNQQLASCMVGQTSAPAKSSRKGKPAAAGTLAWTAFVAHVVKSMPERFAPPALPKERLSIAGAIRLENPEAYKAFCEKFVADMPARDSDAESVTSPQESVASSAAASASDKPKRVISDEQKAKMKAGREATAAAKKNGTYVPKKKAEKAEKAEKPKAEKPKPKAKAKGKKVAKAEPEAAAQAEAVTVDSSLEKITVDGITYWLNTTNNNLYDLEGEGMGAFAGAYMPGNEEGEMVDFEAVEA